MFVPLTFSVLSPESEPLGVSVTFELVTDLEAYCEALDRRTREGRYGGSMDADILEAMSPERAAAKCQAITQRRARQARG